MKLLVIFSTPGCLLNRWIKKKINEWSFCAKLEWTFKWFPHFCHPGYLRAIAPAGFILQTMRFLKTDVVGLVNLLQSNYFLLQKIGFLLIRHSLRKKKSSEITLESCFKQQHKNNSSNYIELKNNYFK